MLNAFRQSRYSPVLSDIESEEKSQRALQGQQLRSPKILSAVVLGALVLGIFFFSGVILEDHFLRNQALDLYQNRERCSSPSTRREWRSFSAAEKLNYLDAVQCLRETPSRLHSDYSLYDDFPWVHTNIGNNCEYSLYFASTGPRTQSLMVSGAHNAAAFVAWHRYFLHSYERALREDCHYTGHLRYTY